MEVRKKARAVRYEPFYLPLIFCGLELILLHFFCISIIQPAVHEKTAGKTALSQSAGQLIARERSGLQAVGQAKRAACELSKGGAKRV